MAAQALAGSLRRRLVAALGTRAGEEPDRLAARAAPRLGVKEAVVSGCLAPRAGATASNEGLLQYARAVHAVERRLRRYKTPAAPSRPASGGGPAAGARKR